MAKTRFDTKGIKSALSKLQFSQANFYKSISEFIWNGFDAKASVVELSYEILQNRNEGRFRKLEIKDNGSGINHDRLENTFEPIFDSEKIS
ncbi:MAG: ATP-binding protein, partial [Thermoplasmatales archaeon]|nr:ATP-binding protein [Candidatus Methanoperedenaceae archaeon]MCG2825709.1 ATP-binding protein [Thermoplasmatales archaeon]